VLSVVAASGYPFNIRCVATLDDAREVVRFPVPPPLPVPAPSPACLLFHRHDARLEDLHQLLIRGQLVAHGDALVLRPIAFVTANGRRGTDRMPHAGSPLHLLQFMLLGRRKARAYLAKRQQPWPPIRYDQMLRAIDE
jgi:hypothetical protein